MKAKMRPRRHVLARTILLPTLTICVLCLLAAAPRQRDSSREAPVRFVVQGILAKGQVREVDDRGMVIRLIERDFGDITPPDIFVRDAREDLIVDLSRAQGHVEFVETKEIIRLADARQRLRGALYVEIAKIRGMRSETIATGGASTPPRDVPGIRQGPGSAQLRPARRLVIEGWVWIRVRGSRQ